MVDYSDRLKTAMTAAGLNTQQLADQLGISYHAVRKVLLGQSKGFSAVHHAAACNILNIDPDWLALGTGARTRPTPTTHTNEMREPPAPYTTAHSKPAATRQLDEAIHMLQQLPAGKLDQVHNFLTFLARD